MFGIFSHQTNTPEQNCVGQDPARSFSLYIFSRLCFRLAAVSYGGVQYPFGVYMCSSRHRMSCRLQGLCMPAVFPFACPLSSAFHCLASAPCHFFCVCLHAVLSYVADAGRAVWIEQYGEYFSYEIRVCPALFHIHAAFRAGAESFVHAALPDFAPRQFLVFNTSGTFPGLEFAACPAIQAACRDFFIVLFHMQK